ncbi:MAG: glycine--tRNA ligase subunit beta [Bacillota bacterium]
MPEKFLLEVGCDEIPARYLPLAVRDLHAKAEAALKEARMAFSDVRTYGTPRRLVLAIEDLSDRSGDAVTEVRGPSKKAAYDQDGNPSKALLGFAKSLGIDPSEVVLKEEAGGEYVYGRRHEKGRPAPEVLSLILPPVVMGLESPYPMRWGEENWRWYRPIRWVVALYGKDVVPLSIAGHSSGRRTLGHRTLHPGPLEVPSAADYFKVMEEALVIVDPDRRAALITEGARQVALELGGEPVIDDELLSEVASLCEHPSAFLGRFEDRYRNLPKEVLMTAMRHHQRYFPIQDSQGNILPGFVGVRDGHPRNSIETVRSGNEWVLRARLKDAEFFFEQDKKVALEDRVPELAGVRFLRNSGTMLDKAGRMERLARGVALSLQNRSAAANSRVDSQLLLDGEAAAKAAKLAKADLVTAMVREFPELEGIMGWRYGELQGLPGEVVAAIRDQYLPRGAKDRLPEPGVPSVIALVDKLDTLAVAFSLGMEVSGSADPFGLRRNAMGVVSILLGHGYDADLEGLLDEPLRLAAEVVSNPAPDRKVKLVQFLLGRVEGALTDRGFAVEVTRAVLGGGEKRVARLPAMAQALSQLAGRAELADVVTGWRRTSVLAKGAEPAGSVDTALLAEEPERALYQVITESSPVLDSMYEEGEYDRYLDRLAVLRRPIDRCLDEVLIMADDLAVRSNRLALLRSASRLYTRYADFVHVLPLIGREG